MTDSDALISKLNQETSKISWLELQKFYASGVVVAAAKEADLIKVAAEFSRDNKAAVAAWLEDGTVFKVEDQLAKDWLHCEQQLWAVVVAPWVLVQEVKS